MDLELHDWTLVAVKDVMRPLNVAALIGNDAHLSDVVGRMELTADCRLLGVIDADGDLVGSIHRSEVERLMNLQYPPVDTPVREVMAGSPKVVDAEERVQKAAFFMREFSMEQLFVIDARADFPKRPVGIILFQDLQFL